MQWLKEVPSHWEERRLKTLVTCNDEALSEKLDKDTEIQYVEIGDVDQINGIKNSTFYKFKDAPSRARRITRVGDIIISTVRTYLKAIAYIDKQDLIVSTGFAVLRPQNVLPRFLAYATMCDGFTTEVLRYSIGISYPAISSNDLLGLKIALPPRPEQEIIVSYLENKTSKIDAYVADKEKEIQLLQELKQKTIADAVTKGLNPKVKMKDSGVSWIGMIPEHWNLRRIKFILSELKEKSETGLETPLSLSKEAGIIPFQEKKNRTMESASYVGGKIVHKGEIVFNRFRARLFAISGYDGIVSSDYAVYKCYEIASPEYMVKLFSTDMYREAFNRKASGIGDGFNRLYTDDLFSIYAIFPPLDEQQSIVAYIEEKCQKIDTLITELQAEIDYLKEYKQRLIADVVTGQVDVQNEMI